MTDRELLEFAAKSAGLRGIATDMNPAEDVSFRVLNNDGSFFYWNPLDDDGDALRLAVKLGMVVDQTPTHAWATVPNVTVGSQPIDDDPIAATRRAITRAAAEIGKAMP